MMGKSCIALIPARSGSRRIKNKNIKNFYGYPIIKYAIKNAIKSGLFDQIIVSTNNYKIKKIANQFGASTPFIRPKKLAKNSTGIIDVISHETKKIVLNYKKVYAVCCIFPATPLLKPRDLKLSFKIFKNQKNDYVFGAQKCNYIKGNCFKLNPSSKIVKSFSNKIKKNKKKLENIYQDVGQFYWAKPSTWIKKKKIFSKKSKVYIFPKNKIVDINTEKDWEKAKLLFKKR